MDAEVESLVNSLLFNKRRREEDAEQQQTPRSSPSEKSTTALSSDRSITPRTAMNPPISADDVASLVRALSKSLKYVSASVERSPCASTLVVRSAVQLVVAISNYEMGSYLIDEASVFALATWALETAEAAYFRQRPHATWTSVNDRVFTTIVRSVAFDTKDDGLLRRQARSAFNALRNGYTSSGHEDDVLLYATPDLVRIIIDAFESSSIKEVVLDAGLRSAVDFL